MRTDGTSAADGATTCIRAASWVVAWDDAQQRHVYRRDVDVSFTDDRITAIDPADGSRPVDGATVIDGRGLLVMPGFVDIHVHPSSEPALKGLTDEVGSRKLWNSSLYEYLFLFRLDEAGMQAASEVALCELMMSGVTSLCDLSNGYPDWLDVLGASGLRVWAAPGYRSARWYTENGHEVRYAVDEAAGRKGFEAALQTIERARQHPSGRLSGMLCPSQIDTVSEDLFRDSVAAARERNLPLQTHAAQSVVEFHEMMRRHGKTPIEWLHHVGALGPATVIGHGIFLDHHSWLNWPSRGDLGLLAETRTSIAHCPTVFSRRGITLEDFGAYRRAGINIGIGTDTFPHNFVEEMRTAAISARIASRDVHSVRAADVFTAATVGGATALGRADIGRLAVGAKADLVLVEATHPSMRPLYDPIKSLIYSAGERPIRDVFVDGRQIVTSGRPMAFDYPDALARLEAAQGRALQNVPNHDWGHRPIAVLMPQTFDTLA